MGCFFFIWIVVTNWTANFDWITLSFGGFTNAGVDWIRLFFGVARDCSPLAPRAVLSSSATRTLASVAFLLLADCVAACSS